MPFLYLVLNIAWLGFGGFVSALGWLVAGIIMAITVVGLPWARAAFNIATYTLFPFGTKAVPRADLTQRSDIGTGWMGTVGNVIWFVFAGWWLALLHVAFAVAFFVTIIGIPFGWAHLKLARLALWPIGQSIVGIDAFRMMQDRSAR